LDSVCVIKLVAQVAEGEDGDWSAVEEVDILKVSAGVGRAAGDDDGDVVFFKAEAVEFSVFRIGGGAFGFFVAERDEAIGEFSDVFAGVSADMEGYAAVDICFGGSSDKGGVCVFTAGGHDFFCDLEYIADFVRVAVRTEILHGHGAQMIADEFG